MAVDDLDVFRTAKLLIDRHDDEAPIYAAMRADELLDAGDLDDDDGDDARSSIGVTRAGRVQALSKVVAQWAFSNH